MVSVDESKLMRHRVPALLERLGIPKRVPLLVHSAFSGLSRQGWRAENFLLGLLEHQSGNTLLMPAMTWRAVNPQTPYFDAASTPGITGILAELFRQNHATHRSVHPTHSTTGWGRDVAGLLDGHVLDTAPCSSNSPFGRLIAADGWVLLVGAGFEVCTTIHCAENALEPDVYLLPTVETYQCRALDGTLHTVATRRHVRRQRDFNKFRPMMIERALRFSRLDVGGVEIIALAAADLDGVVRQALNADAGATLLPT